MNKQKALITILLLLHQLISPQAEDRIIGTSLFVASTGFALATQKYKNSESSDQADAKSMIEFVQKQENANQLKNAKKFIPKTPTLLTYTPQWHEQNPLFLSPKRSSSPTTIATISPNLSNNSLSHLATQNHDLSFHKSIHNHAKTQHRTSVNTMTPWDTSHFNDYIFIAIDTNNDLVQELSTNPQSEINEIIQQANAKINAEPSLYEQSNIVAQGNFQIRQLAAQYDNGIGYDSQAAKEISLHAFSQHNERLGKWQYKCDHIKQKGSKRACINSEWTTQELRQLWIAKQIYQRCKTHNYTDIQTILNGYEALDSETQEALRTAIKEEIKSLKSSIDQQAQNYLHQNSSNNSSSSSKK